MGWHINSIWCAIITWTFYVCHIMQSISKFLVWTVWILLSCDAVCSWIKTNFLGLGNKTISDLEKQYGLGWLRFLKFHMQPIFKKTSYFYLRDLRKLKQVIVFGFGFRLVPNNALHHTNLLPVWTVLFFVQYHITFIFFLLLMPEMIGQNTKWHGKTQHAFCQHMKWLKTLVFY